VHRRVDRIDGENRRELLHGHAAAPCSYLENREWMYSKRRQHLSGHYGMLAPRTRGVRTLHSAGRRACLSNLAHLIRLLESAASGQCQAVFHTDRVR
jgi:hypothetical protein